MTLERSFAVDVLGHWIDPQDPEMKEYPVVLATVVELEKEYKGVSKIHLCIGGVPAKVRHFGDNLTDGLDRASERVAVLRKTDGHAHPFEVIRLGLLATFPCSTSQVIHITNGP